jgi:hypothetical protein
MLRLPNGRTATVGPLTVAARDAMLVRFAGPARRRPVGVRNAFAVAPPQTGKPRPTGMDIAPGFATHRNSAAACEMILGFQEAADEPRLFDDDDAEDGFSRLTFMNAAVALTIAPNAGGRALRFAPRSPRGCILDSIFTSVGALRDDVAIQPPLSTTDRIGKYTRSFPAGTFNRSYAVASSAISATTASATLEYTAPDVVPNGARFRRTIRLRTGESGFTVLESASFGAGRGAERQRAVRYDSFDTRAASTLDERERGTVGFFFPARGRVVVVAWPPAQVEGARLIAERTSTVLRLQFGPGPNRTRYALDRAVNAAQARAMLAKERGIISAER